MNTTTPLGTALLRGLIGGVIAAGVAFFAVGPTQGVEMALWLGGGAFFTYLAPRLGEGVWDNRSGAQVATDEHRAVEDRAEPHEVTIDHTEP